MIERETFEAHFRTCFEPLTRYAYIYVKDREQAKEIVQQIFTALWEKRRTVLITSSLRTYLYQTVKNKSLNHLRDKKKIVFVHEVPEEITDEQDTAATCSFDDLNFYVQQLPARCREIFMLKRMQGLSYKEIGLRLDISEKSVENQMTIAFRKLRAAVAQQNYVVEQPIVTSEL